VGKEENGERFGASAKRKFLSFTIMNIFWRIS
jgi:hypothetical protein